MFVSKRIIQFPQPRQKSSDKKQKHFRSFPKKKENIVFLSKKKLFFSVCSQGQGEISFDNFVNINLDEGWKNLFNDRKQWKFFVKRNLFLSNCTYGYVECSFDDPAENF